jgi:anti-sigma factor RsiW
MSQVLEKRTLECSDVVALLGDYVDGELIPSLELRVKAHVDSCEHCLEMMISYQETVQMAKDLPEVSIGVDAQNRLRRNLNQRLGLKIPLLPSEES